jgi:hypothetical protein
MASRKMKITIWCFIGILVIASWLLRPVTQAGAQIQKAITGQNNPAVDLQASQDKFFVTLSITVPGLQ